MNFGSDFSSMIFGKCFLFRFFFGIFMFFQVYLVENYSSEIFGADFYAEVLC